MNEMEMQSVAVIGMAGRFPGASDIQAFWHNLRDGVESISRFDPSDVALKQVIGPREERVYARGILDKAEFFDASFFGCNTKEAEMMDPQHRVFLEIAWEAIEHAGYDVDRIDGPVGLFAGTGLNTYLLYNLCSSRAFIEELLDNHQVGAHPALLGNDKDFLTTRVAYKLGLKGPAVTVQSACSTSLVSVVMAWQSLMSYQCDMALAGGVSISFPQNRAYPYLEGAMVSRDGRCRAFDAAAQGMLYGAGAGLVVLKRLEDAINDGDSIYALIRGAATNNDGSSKVSYMAPSIEGQSAVILAAQELAGIDPETVSYVEAHGTGTPLGDPIEIAGLTKAFRAGTPKKQFCAIGSVKTNIGHLETAAGVAGLIKTVLSLYNKEIPASLNFTEPNPKIDFDSSPFYVNTELRPWKTDGYPRTAGVSSFGVGGTNAHVVLQEAPPHTATESRRRHQLLVLSARSESALQLMRTNLADFLETAPNVQLADVAFTLQTGRKLFSHRHFWVASTVSEAVSGLRKSSEKSSRLTDKRQREAVVFLFPGQGVQYVQMGRELFRDEIVFRESVQECCQLLERESGTNLQAILYPDYETEQSVDTILNQTECAQPAIFIIEYALAQLWMSWGIKPAAILGHSIGEYVAAVLSGVMELKDALSLLTTRAKMMQALPPGGMLAVRLGRSELESLLPEGCSIAAINGEKLSVVSGRYEELRAFKAALHEQGVVVTDLHTSHAFHSSMMDPMLDDFAQVARKIPMHPPKVPWISTRTGRWMTGQELAGGDYWVQQIRSPVLFAESIGKLLEDNYKIFLEVGPGQTLSQLTRHNVPKGLEVMAIPSLGPLGNHSPDTQWLLSALGKLWSEGVDIDWRSFYNREKRRRIALPTYPFERKKYWVEPSSPDTPEKDREMELEPVSSKKESEMQADQNAGQAAAPSLKQQLLDELKKLLKQFSGDDYSNADPDESFMDMGFDSLFLTQFSQGVSQHFSVKVTFRQMMEELGALNSLCDFVAQAMPPETLAGFSPQQPPVDNQSPEQKGGAPVFSVVIPQGDGPLSSPSAHSLQAVIPQQVALMGQQLELLRQTGFVVGGGISVASSKAGSFQEASKKTEPVITAVNMGKKAYFGPFKAIEKGAAGGLTDAQQKALNTLIERYNRRTAKSKAYAQQHRAYFCDPRAAGNFRQMWKEMVYPIVCQRSKGSRIWDIDDNEYVDITMGFGANYLGHSPDYVVEALREQLNAGIEIGPQSPLAGEVAQLICEFTGMERVTFCNTGSEAVMAAFRVARTVTGRQKIVYFYGDYHGVFDEVLGGPALVDGLPGAMPIAPGIPRLPNVMILEYGNPASLETIRKHADEIAGVIVEPVQSRNPDLQPREFLQQLRTITQEKGIVFIFDEIITGFRIAPGGAQEHFGVKADMATYGKVVGGGMPIGVLAGAATYMDALDGGYWQYGDGSSPPTGVTFFAGTFVRHPLAMAAARAALTHLKSVGPALQRNTNARAAKFVEKMNRFFKARELPMRLQTFSSLFYYDFHSDLKYASLLFYYMRDRGMHIFEGRGAFISAAHDDHDMDLLLKAFQESVDEMQAGGFLPPAPASSKDLVDNVQQANADNPPVPGARLGRDQDGNPAWFIADPEREGKFLQLEVK